GPGRGPGRVELGRRDGADEAGVEAGGGGDVASELVPGRGALVGDVEHARPAGDHQPADHPGQVVGEGRAPDLVVDDPHGVAGGKAVQHRLDEVPPVPAAEPRGADDRVGRAQLEFATEL